MILRSPDPLSLYERVWLRQTTPASTKRDPEKPLRVTDRVCGNISIHVILTGMFVFRIAHIKIAISLAGNEQSTPNLQRRSSRQYFCDSRRKMQKHFCRHMVGFRAHGHIYMYNISPVLYIGMLHHPPEFNSLWLKRIKLSQ